jgi:hypothetical protein
VSIEQLPLPCSVWGAVAASCGTLADVSRPLVQIAVGRELPMSGNDYPKKAHNRSRITSANVIHIPR